MHLGRILASLCCLVSLTAGAESNWSIGVREGGNGFYLAAPDQSFHLNLLGYGQFLGHMLSQHYQRGDRADHTAGFSVRRARLSTLVTVHRTFEFLTEIGTPTQRPLVATTAFPGGTAPGAAAGLSHGLGSAGDIGLVEARLTAPLFSDWLQLRVGKFIGPFSQENARHPRSLDVIERFSVVNALHTIPALDTQVGLMFFGRVASNVFNYYLALFNGNADSISSGTDEDGAKELQLKLVFQPHRRVVFGLGFATNRSPAKLLSLVDHAFAPVVTGLVTGARHGGETDVDVSVDWFSYKMEGQYWTFPDSTATGFMSSLFGIYNQFGFQVAGDQTHGLQIIGRHEWARANVNGNYDLHSGILGFNIFINSNLKNTVNYIAEIPSAAAGSTAYSTTDIKHILYNQLQVKF